jgi:hypothetical protein
MNTIGIDVATLIEGIQATGSRVICNPPVLDTDEDYVVLTKDIHAFMLKAKADGFTSSAREEYEFHDTDFMCFRKGELNLIVTTSLDFYTRWKLATLLATRFNLLVKQDRRDLFSVILHGELASAT